MGMTAIQAKKTAARLDHLKRRNFVGTKSHPPRLCRGYDDDPQELYAIPA